MAEQGLGRLPGGVLEAGSSQNVPNNQGQGPARIIGDYAVTQQIGSGSFAVVWKGRHRETGREVAIKEIATEKLNKKLKESLESEIAILEKANHPNIIHLIEIVKVRA
jgi:serine/threonine-protein kinase ULK/ATG1